MQNKEAVNLKTNLTGKKGKGRKNFEVAKKSDSTSKCSHVIDENGQILFHEYKKVRNSIIQY